MSNVKGKHNKAGEKVFENEIRHCASLMRCAYYKIPDPIVTVQKIQDRKNYMMTEEKRPFDGVLVTPKGNYCIECKYNYNRLSPHQKENLERIEEINGMGYVLRKIEKLDETGYKRIYVKYRKEKNGETLLETDDPMVLIRSFVEDRE